MLPNVRLAHRTGSCASHFDLGTVVVGGSDEPGLVCRDLGTGQDWMANPGIFPSNALIEASRRASSPDLSVRCAPIQTGPAHMTESTVSMAFVEDYAGFLSALQRAGFMRVGNQAGVAAVVTDRVPALMNESLQFGLENLTRFWRIVLCNI